MSVYYPPTIGIASGKSTVAQIFRDDLGVSVLDADKLGHEVYEPGTSAFQSLVQHFGQSIVNEDGQINRRALGNC